jgi:hypothetical protein
MTEKYFFTYVKEKARKYLVFIAFFSIVLMVIWAFSARNFSITMENTIHHAIIIKPTILEELQNWYPKASLYQEDLTFSFRNSSTTISRDNRTGFEKRSGVYTYLINNSRGRIIVNWEEENNIFSITSIVMR